MIRLPSQQSFGPLSRVTAIFTLLLASVNPVTAVAQQDMPPDAGRLLEQERPALPQPAAPPPAEPASDTAPTPPPEGPRFPVGKVRIAGASIFSEEALHALVADVEGQELSLAALHAVADRITQYYRQRGYVLAYAYVPAQKISDGVIELAVVEGRIGAVSVRNDELVGGAALEPLAALVPGEVARAQTLERSVLLLSDLPGLVITSTLKPGSAPGTSDLMVDVAPGARVSGNMELDGNGDRFSGRIRAGAAVNVNNPLQLGDQLTLRGRASDEGLHYVFGEYRLPVNRWGTRIGMSVSELQYRLGDSLAALGLEGDALSVNVTASHPLVRARRTNINAEVQAGQLTMQDRITATDTVIDRTIRLWRAGLNGNWLDDWSGSGSWSAEYISGNLALDADTALLDQAGPRAAGHFGKWNFSLRRLQGMTPASSLLLSFSGQVAEKNLDSSQKMVLGGANGVRAYPQGEGFGDQGYMATVELRQHLPVPVAGLWQGSVFVDHGMVEASRNAWTPDPNTRRLTGGGLGLTVVFEGDWSVRTALAWRMGSDLPRNDIDRLPRGWVQVVKGF